MNHEEVRIGDQAQPSLTGDPPEMHETLGLLGTLQDSIGLIAIAG